MRLFHKLIPLALLLASSSSALASTKPVALIVVDRRSPPESGLSVVDPEASSIVSFDIENISTGASATTLDCSKLRTEPPFAQTNIWHFYECATAKDQSLETRARAAWALAEAAKAASKDGSTRAISRKGDQIAIAIVHDATLLQASMKPIGNTPGPTTAVLIQGQRYSASVKEEKRESRIESDLETLARLATAIGGVAALRMTSPGKILAQACGAAEKPVVWTTSYQYTLRLDRATATVEQKAGSATAPVTLATANIPYEKDKPECAELREPPKDAKPDEQRAWAISEWRRRVAAEAQRSAMAEQQLAINKRSEAIVASCGGTSDDPLAIFICQIRNGSDVDARVAAVDALGDLNDRVAVPTLEWASINAPPKVKVAAFRTLGKFPANTGSRPPATPAAAAAPAAASIALLTGSAEHLFLSADASLSDTDLTTKDNKLTVGKPSLFYVGVNYLIGDLARTDQKRAWDGIFFKLMVKGSKQPLDSWGVAVGFRGGYGKQFGIDLNTLSPWAAIVSTKRADADEGRDFRVQYGVSLNLDSALAWLTSK